MQLEAVCVKLLIYPSNTLRRSSDINERGTLIASFERDKLFFSIAKNEDDRWAIDYGRTSHDIVRRFAIE
jgi:hypothetical protein